MKPFSKEGLGLPMILGACGILAIATGVVGAYAVSNLNTLGREQVYDQCHYGSYSGIQWALSQVSSDPRTSCANPTDIIQTLGFSSSADLRCDVFIYSNLPQAVPPWTVAPDGTVIPEGVIYVVANSKLMHNSNSAGARSAQLTALCTPSLFYFNNALLADTGATVKNGSILDAYTGPTYATNTGTPPTANITTNANSGTGAVSIDGTGTVVHGGTLVGTGGTVSPILAVTGGAVEDGPDGVLGAAVPLKLANPPGQPYSTIAPGALNTIKHLVGGTTYLISGDLNVGSSGGFFVDPNPSPPTPATAQDDSVFVFVQGDITVASGAVFGDPTQKADSLQIYVPKRKGPGGPHHFDMTGATGSFLLAGPDVIATVTNSEIQGALIAEKVTVDNSKVHYDSGLFHKARGPMGWSVGGFDSDHNKGSGYGTYGPAPAPYVAPPPPAPPGSPPAPPPYSPPTSPPSTTGSTGSSMLP